RVRAGCRCAGCGERAALDAQREDLVVDPQFVGAGEAGGAAWIPGGLQAEDQRVMAEDPARGLVGKAGAPASQVEEDRLQVAALAGQLVDPRRGGRGQPAAA